MTIGVLENNEDLNLENNTYFSKFPNTYSDKSIETLKENMASILMSHIALEQKLNDILKDSLFRQDTKEKIQAAIDILETNYTTLEKKTAILEEISQKQIKEKIKKCTAKRNLVAHRYIQFHNEERYFFFRCKKEKIIKLDDSFWNEVEECYRKAFLILGQIEKDVRDSNKKAPS